jgi:hypothetical protein
MATKFERRDGRPTLFCLPQVDFVDDGPGKPVDINEVIGRLDKALKTAATDRWLVIDMRRDWKTVFPAGP